MIFGIKEKIYHFDPNNVFLDIATNIPQRLKTGFLVQGHICLIGSLIMLAKFLAQKCKYICEKLLF